MIDIIPDQQTVRASIMGEFTLSDFNALEEALRHGFEFQGKMKLLIDLRDMLGFTLDVAWEELRFARAYGQDFSRVALVSESEWIARSALFQRMFSDAPVQGVDDNASAEAWLQETPLT